MMSEIEPTVRIQMHSWPRLSRSSRNLKKSLQIFQTRSLQSRWRSWLALTRRTATLMRSGAHVVFHPWPRWKQPMQHCIKKRWASMRSRLLAYLTTSTSSPSRLAVRLTCPPIIMVTSEKSCFLCPHCIVTLKTNRYAVN